MHMIWIHLMIFVDVFFWKGGPNSSVNNFKSFAYGVQWILDLQHKNKKEWLQHTTAGFLFNQPTTKTLLSHEESLDCTLKLILLEILTSNLFLKLYTWNLSLWNPLLETLAGTFVETFTWNLSGTFVATFYSDVPPSFGLTRNLFLGHSWGTLYSTFYFHLEPSTETFSWHFHFQFQLSSETLKLFLRNILLLEPLRLEPLTGTSCWNLLWYLPLVGTFCWIFPHPKPGQRPQAISCWRKKQLNCRVVLLIPKKGLTVWLLVISECTWLYLQPPKEWLRWPLCWTSSWPTLMKALTNQSIPRSTTVRLRVQRPRWPQVAEMILRFGIRGAKMKNWSSTLQVLRWCLG